MADRNPKGNARRDLVLPVKSTTRPNAGEGYPPTSLDRRGLAMAAVEQRESDKIPGGYGLMAAIEREEI